jgi:hypothetical protein
MIQVVPMIAATMTAAIAKRESRCLVDSRVFWGIAAV